jgi:hypothetical protein
MAIPNGMQKGSTEVDVRIPVIAYAPLESAAMRHISPDEASETACFPNGLAADHR